MNNILMNGKTTEFGIKCRERRVSLKLTMAQIAKKIGYAQSTVTKIEQGGQPPSFEYIKESLEIYEIKEKKNK
jgi:transcriptional regulator with XRE-family HTH domain